jgi:putative alpha-1,2-mannosidase
LDGEVWSRNWIGHEFFTNGGVLELVLGSEESEWGTGVGDRPPSMERNVMEL